MKRFLLLTTIAWLATSGMSAQDDMYFTPKKKTAEEIAAEKEKKARLEAYRKAHTIDNTFYVGSNRNVDEYNRRHRAPVVTTDSVGNDIITFTPGTGIYPDSVLIPTDSLYQLELADTQTKAKKKNREYYDDDDFYFSRRMNRFYGYAGPYWGPWRHYYDPWYWDFAYTSYYGWNPYWYDPFYYDPFYYPWSGWGYGWGAYPYWGYHNHGYVHIGGGHYGGGHSFAQRDPNGPRTATGTRNHSATRSSYASLGNSTSSRSGYGSVSRGVASQDRVSNRLTQTVSRLYGSNSNITTRSSSSSSSRSANRSTSSYDNSSRPVNTNVYSPSSSSSMSSSSGGFSGGGTRSSGGGGGSRGGGFGGRR